MIDQAQTAAQADITGIEEFVKRADYSLINTLTADPDSTADGNDHRARQVFSGHYVPVAPTPIAEPDYIAHSSRLFSELGFSDDLALDPSFQQLFSGDLSAAAEPMLPYGWATGYALSIYGTEYTQQCPFQTGNGYGDGRAISIFEGVFKGQRWEMQLKGGGTTPYCRGGDGRAVLRSSVREFLAQELMYALGVPTSRSLTLYVSQAENVTRPWYSQYSQGYDPDIYVDNPVAISTRVAPSFLRVGQLELFARRVRNNAHPKAMEELRAIVLHVIEREYANEIDQQLSFSEKIIELSKCFRQRLTSLVANWIRVGYCQGNFNSDNCAMGGYTLDYGPFGFCELFDTEFQPWTGGGQHFSLFNQPRAAEANYHMFWQALRQLLIDDEKSLTQLDALREGFADNMQTQLQTLWADKLGLREFNAELFNQLIGLMSKTEVDFTIFFRELSDLPDTISVLKKSFYVETSTKIDKEWQDWLNRWRQLALQNNSREIVAEKMKQTNPKYTWREWLVVPAYQQAAQGDYGLVRELQSIFANPYDEQSQQIEEKYYRLKPREFFNAGGVSHYSCSS